MANIPILFPIPPQSHINFVLPGLRNDAVAVQKHTLLLVLAYSREWNSRRLEHHFYGIWNSVLANLTCDQAMLLPIPQHHLFYVVNPKDPGNSSMGSYTEPDARNIIPDFAIIFLRHMWRASAPRNVCFSIETISTSWHHVKGLYAGVPVIVEIKRCVNRHVDLQAFIKQLRILMGLAVSGVEKQAYHLFKNTKHSEQESVILLACVGEWWKWRIATRAQILTQFDGVPQGDDDEYVDQGLGENEDEEDEDEKDDEDEEDEDESERSELLELPDESEDADEDVQPQQMHAVRMPEIFDDVNDPEEAFTALGDDGEVDSGDEDNDFILPMNHFTDIGDAQARVLADANDAWPPRHKFSKVILLGSSASNQRFYLIHQRLGEICASPDQKTRG